MVLKRTIDIDFLFENIVSNHNYNEWMFTKLDINERQVLTLFWEKDGLSETGYKIKKIHQRNASFFPWDRPLSNTSFKKIKWTFVRGN